METCLHILKFIISSGPTLCLHTLKVENGNVFIFFRAIQIERCASLEQQDVSSSHLINMVNGHNRDCDTVEAMKDALKKQYLIAAVCIKNHSALNLNAETQPVPKIPLCPLQLMSRLIGPKCKTLRQAGLKTKS